MNVPSSRARDIFLLKKYFELYCFELVCKLVREVRGEKFFVRKFREFRSERSLGCGA